MKKVTCNRCGCKNAADFVVKILCPKKSCANYDSKLSIEQKLEYEQRQKEKVDFIAGPDGSVVDWDSLYPDDLEIDFDDDDWD